MTRRSFHFQIAALFAPATPSLHYILLDIPSQQLSVNWPDANSPVSFGSLLKPFLLLAFAKTHPQFPEVICHGTASGCWLPQGHGRQTVVPALSNSCNAYFLALAARIDRAALANVCLEYQLSPPAEASTPGAWVGLKEGWPQSPEPVLRAFRRLVQNRSNATVGLALTGMELCARKGTGRAAALHCFAKTGTAPCSHSPRAEGDGFAVLIYPTDAPRLVLLAGMHGTTGAHTAGLAGDLLRTSFGVR
jgi:cell division protein FtsI/penicillin-binding protein 2